MSDPLRPIADQRRLLVATIRGAADWRAGRADKFEHDRDALRENVRAKTALRTLANFVEGCPTTIATSTSTRSVVLTRATAGCGSPTMG